MRIDQAGQDRLVGEINDRCRCVAAACADADNLAVFDDDRLVRQHLAGTDIQQVSGVNDGARGSRRGVLREGAACEQRDDTHNAKSLSHIAT